MRGDPLALQPKCHAKAQRAPNLNFFFKLYILCVLSGLARDRKIRHESQKVTDLPNGSLETTFRVAGMDEIKRWVLSFGPDVVVLEPEKLKGMITNELNKTLAHYGHARNISKAVRSLKQVDLISS